MLKYLVVLITLGMLSAGCNESSHYDQQYIEGVVEKVEYTQTGGGFLNPSHQDPLPKTI